jgi:hypothetical protein
MSPLGVDAIHQLQGKARLGSPRSRIPIPFVLQQVRQRIPELIVSPLVRNDQLGRAISIVVAAANFLG